MSINIRQAYFKVAQLFGSTETGAEAIKFFNNLYMSEEAALNAIKEFCEGKESAIKFVIYKITPKDIVYSKGNVIPQTIQKYPILIGE